MFAEACRLGLEGIVSKRRDAPHKPGRADTWLKTKCIHRQEFVIGGFTDPEGSREGIGALLVGVYENDGRLTFGGKVGTGSPWRALAIFASASSGSSNPTRRSILRPKGGWANTPTG